MTEQIAGQNAIVWAEIANITYQDNFEVRDIPRTTESGFTHVAASTPNYNPYAWVDDFGNLHAGQVHDGFSGQSFYSGSTNTLVIGLRGTDSLADWIQNLSPGSVPSGSTHPQIESAREYAAQMIARYPNANIVFTGHSLGAYLGTILGYEHRNAKVVGFNSPGINLAYFGGQNQNVYYVYSEDWGSARAIHSAGDFSSGNVLVVPNTSGHGLTDLIEGMRTGSFKFISLADVQDRLAASFAISSAKLIAVQNGIPLSEAVTYQLIAAIGDDRRLLNSEAFKGMIVDLLSDQLGPHGLAQVLAEVVHETNGQCFPAGTLISMANGTQRRIEDICAGDIVLSFDPATGAHLPRAVTKLYRGETDVWVNLTYTQNGVEKSLSTTPEHPFLTPVGQFAPISQAIKYLHCMALKLKFSCCNLRKFEFSI